MNEPGTGAHVAYFINQYPGISHSFIRREIQALERHGLTVTRFVIRPSLDEIISEEDREEFEKTRHITKTAPLALVGAMARAFFKAPVDSVSMFVKAVRLGRCSEAGLLRHLFYFAEALVLADWMRAGGLRHVHAHFGTNASMIAMLASGIGKFTFSSTVHGPEEFEKHAQISLEDKLAASAFTVAISNYGAAQLKKISDPAQWPKIRIVHCGVERSFYEDAVDDPPDNHKAVCVGRLCAEKGQIDLVRAAAIVSRKFPRFGVDLIGDGPMRQSIEAEIRDLNLGETVSLAGWKTPSEVKTAIEGARLFVLPSYAEGLPVSIMEAMSLRRPVVSTYIAGIPELVIDGKTGWLAPAGDVEAIAAAIEASLDLDREAYLQMTHDAFARVTARHNIDVETQKLARLFSEAMSHG